MVALRGDNLVVSRLASQFSVAEIVSALHCQFTTRQVRYALARMLDTRTILALKPAEIAFPMNQRTVYFVNPKAVGKVANEGLYNVANERAEGLHNVANEALDTAIDRSPLTRTRTRAQLLDTCLGFCSSLYLSDLCSFVLLTSARRTSFVRCGCNHSREYALLDTLFGEKPESDTPMLEHFDYTSLSAEEVDDIFPPLPAVIEVISPDIPAPKSKSRSKPKKDNPRTPVANAIVKAYLDALGDAARDTTFARIIRTGYALAERDYTPEQVTAVYTELKSEPFWQYKTLSLETVAKNMQTILAKIRDKGARQTSGIDDRGRFNIRMTPEYAADLAERRRPKTDWEEQEAERILQQAKDNIRKLMAGS